MRKNELGKFYYFDEKESQLPCSQMNKGISFFEVLLLRRGRDTNPPRIKEDLRFTSSIRKANISCLTWKKNSFILGKR